MTTANRHQNRNAARDAISLQDLMTQEYLQVWGGDVLRTIHVPIMF
jgi:hypothetical protein